MKRKTLINKSIASIITCSLSFILILVFVIVSLIVNSYDEPTDEQSGQSSLKEASQVFVEPSDEDITESSSYSGDLDEEFDVSVDINFQPSEETEPKHCFVKNKYGYTFIYGDTGYEQFNYGSKSLNSYISGLNSLAACLPETTRIFNISVPVSTTFAEIPSEIKAEHDFYNKSQGTFVELVQSELDEKITNISIVDKIKEGYDNDEYLFFRTDRNWTPLASYTAYAAFCETAGIAPYAITNFPETDLGDYLGWFHFATQDEDMAKNPDNFVYYSPLPSVKTVLTVYNGDRKMNNYKLCANLVDVNDAYNVFVGTTAGRYEINTTAKGGNLLIIGDSSVLPMLSFLSAHYGTIDVINPLYYEASLSEFIENRYYSDVITMCYTTNATAGDYTPAFNSFTGGIYNYE